ncbi:hypothetical protein O3P69_009128 [Scylla paramamosain]|uniref:Uncharacterized protein n=1 Tax=Scylla paramamosain TaxID=85552 RepID=A0AAW0TA27_SCYPA
MSDEAEWWVGGGETRFRFEANSGSRTEPTSTPGAHRCLLADSEGMSDVAEWLCGSVVMLVSLLHVGSISWVEKWWPHPASSSNCPTLQAECFSIRRPGSQTARPVSVWLQWTVQDVTVKRVLPVSRCVRDAQNTVNASVKPDSRHICPNIVFQGKSFLWLTAAKIHHQKEEISFSSAVPP